MQSKLDSRQFGELKWGAAIWAWFKDNCLRIEMRDEVWAWFKTTVLRIEMGHAIQTWLKTIVWGFKWEMQPNLIQDNYSCEDSNERCNLNLVQNNFSKMTFFKSHFILFPLNVMKLMNVLRFCFFWNAWHEALLGQ